MNLKSGLTIDKDMLPPDVVLTPSIVILDVAVLKLRQRRQRGRRSWRQELWRRGRAERLADGLVLVLHDNGSLITHRGRVVREWRGVRARRRAAREYPAQPARPRVPPHGQGGDTR